MPKSGKTGSRPSLTNWTTTRTAWATSSPTSAKRLKTSPARTLSLFTLMTLAPTTCKPSKPSLKSKTPTTPAAPPLLLTPTPNLDPQSGPPLRPKPTQPAAMIQSTSMPSRTLKPPKTNSRTAATATTMITAVLLRMAAAAN